MSRWVGPGGWLVLPQSARPPSFDPPLGISWLETRSYVVPGGQTRNLWIGKLDPEAGV
jgi:hypothetical protein